MSGRPKQQDISHAAVRLGRLVDRLPPGSFVVILEKPAKGAALDLSVEVHRIDSTSRIVLRPHQEEVIPDHES